MLDPTRVTPQPWLNGAGFTRELASASAPDTGLLWRISVADLDCSADFSPFPRLNRLFVPLGPLRLTVDGEPRVCEAGDQVRFSGEARVSATVPAPTRALNVMTRPGAYRAEVLLRSHDGTVAGGSTVLATVILGSLAADVHLVKISEDFHD
ncbi:MAG: HutD family protein [Nocardioides sp.]|nr:HutD family protein [Nocardioides sp.]